MYMIDHAHTLVHQENLLYQALNQRLVEWLFVIRLITIIMNIVHHTRTLCTFAVSLDPSVQVSAGCMLCAVEFV